MCAFVLVHLEQIYCLSTCVSCCRWCIGGSFQDSLCGSGRVHSLVLFCSCARKTCCGHMSECLHPPSIHTFACKRCIWRVHEQPSLCFHSVVLGDIVLRELWCMLLTLHVSGRCVLVAECEYVCAALLSSVIVLHVPTHLGSACINASTHAALLYKCNKSGASLDAL